MKRFSLCTALLCAFVAGQRAGAAADAYSAAEHDRGTCDVRCTGSPRDEIRTVGYDTFDVEDQFDEYSSGFERLRHSLCDTFREMRLRHYKRAQRKHRHLLYPQCPPYCSPTYGYHPTQWRPFPQDCEYSWTSAPVEPLWQTPATAPALLPLTPTPTPTPGFVPQPAPGVESPYFPDAGPMLQPDETAPDAPPSEAPGLPPLTKSNQPVRPAVKSASYDPPVLMHIQ